MLLCKSWSFSIAIPDDWTYTENETKDEASFSLAPPADLPVNFFFTAAAPAPYKPYKDFSEKASKDAAKLQDWTYVESLENNLVLKNGTAYKEYTYKYTDKDNRNFVFVYSFIENKGNIYLFIAIADDNISGDLA